MSNSELIDNEIVTGYHLNHPADLEENFLSANQSQNAVIQLSHS